MSPAACPRPARPEPREPTPRRRGDEIGSSSWCAPEGGECPKSLGPSPDVGVIRLKMAQTFWAVDFGPDRAPSKPGHPRTGTTTQARGRPSRPGEGDPAPPPLP